MIAAQLTRSRAAGEKRKREQKSPGVPARPCSSDPGNQLFPGGPNRLRSEIADSEQGPLRACSAPGVLTGHLTSRMTPGPPKLAPARERHNTPSAGSGAPELRAHDVAAPEVEFLGREHARDHGPSQGDLLAPGSPRRSRRGCASIAEREQRILARIEPQPDAVGDREASLLAQGVDAADQLAQRAPRRPDRRRAACRERARSGRRSRRRTPPWSRRSPTRPRAPGSRSRPRGRSSPVARRAVPPRARARAHRSAAAAAFMRAPRRLPSTRKLAFARSVQSWPSSLDEAAELADVELAQDLLAREVRAQELQAVLVRGADVDRAQGLADLHPGALAQRAAHLHDAS